MTMKVKHIIKFAVVALIFSISFTAAAQSLRTGYFLKGNPYSHRLNPALMNDRHYISFPMLGSINLNTAGKFGISKFIYDAPNGNGLVTFMHPSIDTDGFMSNIDSNNRFPEHCKKLGASGIRSANAKTAHTCAHNSAYL